MLSITVYLTPALALSQVFGSPLSAPYGSQDLEPRTTFNCSDIHGVFDSSCWETLDIAKYLNDPVTGWNKTTPTCEPVDDGSKCCLAHEPWTTCFLRLATGTTGTDCTLIGQPVSACTFSTSVYPNLSPSIRNQVRYVVYAIVAVNSFFDSMATTANAAQNLYYSNLDQEQLWSLLGHNHEPLPTFDSLSVTYSLGAPFLASLSALDSPVPVEATSYTASTQFTRSLHAAPSVAQAIWPHTGNGLDSSTQIFQRGLSLLMSDVPSFIAFCSTGAFSSENPPRFHSSSDALPFAGAANVYIASTMLQLDGWYAVPAAIVSTASVQAERDCTPLGTGGWLCRGSGGRVGYHSAITGRSYALKYQGKREASINGADLLRQIGNSTAISVPVLFDGAYHCTFKGAAGYLLGVGADGSIDTSCMSVLPMYLPKGSDCPLGATGVRGKCPFGFEG